MKGSLRTAAVIFTATLLAGCHPGPTEQEQQIMAQLEASLVPQCVGRYVVDLPKSFAWQSPNVTLYYGKDIDFTKIDVQVVDQSITKTDFDKAVVAREIKLKAITNLKTQTSNLIATTKRADAILFTSYNDFSYTTGRLHELHELVGNAHVVIKAKSYEGVKSASDSPKALSPAVQAHMFELASHIHPVTNPEKAGPGFCLGAVVIDSNNDYETAILDAKGIYGAVKNTRFHIFNSSFKERDPNDHGLIQRSKEPLAAATSVKTLHIGKTRIGDMPGEEVLTTAPVGNGITQFFLAESRPPTVSLATPTLHIEFRGGKAHGRRTDKPSPLTTNEAVSLWNAVIQSIRPRSPYATKSDVQ